jgi:hypothetical protein
LELWAGLVALLVLELATRWVLLALWVGACEELLAMAGRPAAREAIAVRESSAVRIEAMGVF